MSGGRLLLAVAGLACLLLVPRVTSAQSFITAWGSYGSGDGQFKTPVGIAIGGSGDIYVTDVYSDRVQVFSSTGAFLRQWYWPGEYNIAVDANENVYMVGPSYPGSPVSGVVRFTRTGTYLGHWDAYPNRWGSIAIDASGNVYVSGSSGSAAAPLIQVFTPFGESLREWSTQSDTAVGSPAADGLAVDASGNVYVACPYASRIQKFANDGTFIAQWGGGAPDGRFEPIRVAIGPDGRVYVVDAGARVQVFTSDGAFVTMWGSSGVANGQFEDPLGIAVDAQSDSYVVDSLNNRIQKFGPGPTPTLSSTWGALKNRYRGARGAEAPPSQAK